MAKDTILDVLLDIFAGLGSGTFSSNVTVINGAGASSVNIQDGGNSITVDGTVAVSGVSGTVAVTQSTSPWVVSGTINAVQSGTWNINNISGTISLPTGAATSALQTQPGVDIGDVTINNASGAGAVNIQDGGNSITVDGTVAISNFPTTLDTNYGTVGANTLRGAAQIGNATGAALFGAGTTSAQVLRVVLPTDQTVIPINDNGGSITVDGTVAVSSISGTVAVTQSTSPWVISGTVIANAGTNLNTSLLALESGGNLATLAGGVSSSVYQANVKQINGVTPLMGNGTTGTGSQRVTIASDNTAFTVNAAQSGTWTNTVTQATAANLNATIGNGSGASAVNIQDGGNSITVDGTVTSSPTTSGTGTASNVNASATNVTLLASNASRKNAVFYNDSASICRVKCGATSSSTSFTLKMFPDSFFSLDNIPLYTGIVDGIWETATGVMRVTEFT